MRGYKQIDDDIKALKSNSDQLIYYAIYLKYNLFLSEYTSLITKDNNLLNIIENEKISSEGLANFQINYIKNINQWLSYFKFLMVITERSIEREIYHIKVLGSDPVMVKAFLFSKQGGGNVKEDVTLTEYIEDQNNSLLCKVLFIQKVMEHLFQPDNLKTIEDMRLYLNCLSNINSVIDDFLEFLVARKKSESFGFTHYFKEVRKVVEINKNNFSEFKEEKGLDNFFKISYQKKIIDENSSNLRRLQDELKDEKATYAKNFITFKSEFSLFSKEFSFSGVDFVKAISNNSIGLAKEKNLILFKIYIFYETLSGVVKRIERQIKGVLDSKKTDNPLVSELDVWTQYATELVFQFSDKGFLNEIEPHIKDLNSMKSIYYFFCLDQTYISFVTLITQILRVLLQLIKKNETIDSMSGKIKNLLTAQKELLVFYKNKFNRNSLHRWLAPISKDVLFDAGISINQGTKGLSIKVILEKIEFILDKILKIQTGPKYEGLTIDLRVSDILIAHCQSYIKMIVGEEEFLQYMQQISKQEFFDWSIPVFPSEQKQNSTISSLENKDESLDLEFLKNKIYDNETKSPQKDNKDSVKTKKKKKKKKKKKPNEVEPSVHEEKKKAKMAVVPLSQVSIGSLSNESEKMCRLYHATLKFYRANQRDNYQACRQELYEFTKHSKVALKLEAVAKLADLFIGISNISLTKLNFEENNHHSIYFLQDALYALEESKQHTLNFETLLESERIDLDESLKSQCETLLSSMKHKNSILSDTSTGKLKNKLEDLENKRQKKYQQMQGGQQVWHCPYGTSRNSRQRSLIEGIFDLSTELSKLRGSLSIKPKSGSDIPGLPKYSSSSRYRVFNSSSTGTPFTGNQSQLVL